MRSCLLVVPVLLLAVSDFDAGVRAYRDEQFSEALDAFSRAEAAAGREASTALLHNRALAAIRAGSLREAEAAAEKAAARGGPEFYPIRDFLLGNAAYLRCERAEMEASMPEAPPFTLDMAIRHGEAALQAWTDLVRAGHTSPAARRNIERVLIKLDALRKKKEEAERRRKEQEKERKKKPQEPPPDPESLDRSQEARIQARMDELSPDLVRRLLETLARKEREKRAMRQEERQSAEVRVEKDW